MREVHSEIDQLGGQVVAVGGSFDFQARALRDGGIGFPLLLDPDAELRAALEFRRLTLREFVGRDSRRRYLSVVRDARQGVIRPKDVTQSPGVVILDPEQRVAWAHRGASLGDYPAVGEVLDRLRSLVGGD